MLIKYEFLDECGYIFSDQIIKIYSKFGEVVALLSNNEEIVLFKVIPGDFDVEIKEKYEGIDDFLEKVISYLSKTICGSTTRLDKLHLCKFEFFK